MKRKARDGASTRCQKLAQWQRRRDGGGSLQAAGGKQAQEEKEQSPTPLRLEATHEKPLTL